MTISARPTSSMSSWRARGKLAAAIVHVEGTAYQGCAVGPVEPANCPTVICRALDVHEHPGRLPAVESYFPYAKAVGT